jgi:hypothetical protein
MRSHALLVPALLLLPLAVLAEPVPGERTLRTAEYRALQNVASGWNTWNTNSVISHVRLPDGFAAKVYENYGAKAGARNDVTSSDAYYNWGALLGVISLPEEGR